MQDGDLVILKDGWIFGYKLHMISSTGSVIVPLAADFTTANVYDNQMYNTMTSSSLLPKEIGYMIGDLGYDDHSLYELSTKRGFELVCPVQRYEHTHTDRLELIHLSLIHISEPTRLLSISYAVFCLKKKKK